MTLEDLEYSPIDCFFPFHFVLCLRLSLEVSTIIPIMAKFILNLFICKFYPMLFVFHKRKKVLQDWIAMSVNICKR